MRALWLLLTPAIAYQALSLFSSLNHLRRRATRKDDLGFRPPVSVLKPLRGLDPNTLEAFVSQASQDYPEFELLFGASEADDPAIPEVERLRQRFPLAQVRMIIGKELLANGKVAVLARLAKEARYPIWVVNDSDIRVSREYLSRVVEPLRQAAIGVVTCLYRASARTLAARWESLGIACDFMPSTLVAQAIGVREFGLGSTLAFRAADLQRAGGFEAFGDYLADDYQLAKRITGLGLKAVLSTYTVETALGDSSWGGVWMHQLRWARTIRASKGRGYAGLAVTHAGLWILVCFALNGLKPALTLLGLRLLSAFFCSLFVLDAPGEAALCWLAPVWDLYAFLIWLTSYSGREVRWRDRRMTIDSKGRIESSQGH